MKGLISPSDAGNPEAWTSKQRATGMALLWLGKKSLASGVAEVERLDPEEAVRSSMVHFKAALDEIDSARLDPPPVFSQGTALARLMIEIRGRKATVYKIEDQESLDIARVELPRLLGAKLGGKFAS
jgi:hypothetical protein